MGGHWSSEEEREVSTLREKQRLQEEINMMKKKMKKKKSFPDMSGDGKVTKKDILMARGVIKKPMKKKK